MCPEVIYLDGSFNFNFDRGLLSAEMPEKTVLISPLPSKISVSFGTYVQGKGIVTEKRLLGGIFGGQITYPKTHNINALTAFNKNLKKHFIKEIESGEIKGFINDEELDINKKPWNNSRHDDKKTGFFARLFEKNNFLFMIEL